MELMKEPILPRDEADRLAKLNSLSILDSAAEERFDRITRIAKRLFNVPIVLVSLIDEDRQWFKSCIGLDVLQTGRDISFCGHAIHDSRLFVVEDTALDPRFSDNPLVLNEPFIRFYAGCPLQMGDGSALGTLCLIDNRVRSFSKQDLELFKDLGKITEMELSLTSL
ncbi:diguanylate cyclase (GGDEF) domain-containing protein [Glaciecola sp. KUL10]|nr:diguanylate cyclase (GGDEF) domain-containing protein [Glaciecola sp. KUL10]